MEHDPLLCADTGEMIEYLAQALNRTSREATILLYAPGARPPPAEAEPSWPTLVFCINNEQAPAKGRAKAEAKTPGSQATLEAYS